MARNIAVGIDIGTYSTNTAVLELENSDKSPKILSLNSYPSAGVRKGNVIEIKEAANSIKESIKSAEGIIGFPIKRGLVSIGGLNLCSVISKGIAAVSRADGEITDNDIKRAVSHSESNLSRMANKSIIHTIPLFYKIDGEYAGKNPTGMKGGKLEVETLFIVNLTQNLNNLLKSIELAGIEVSDVVASPVAAGRILLDKRQKEVGSLVLDIGGGTISAAVFEEGLPVYLNSFPFGGDNITNDIALLIQIPLSEAEKIKHLYGKEEGKFDKQIQKKLNEIIQARLADAFELTTEHLRKIGRERLLPGGVILTGGGANLPSIANAAKFHLKMNAEVGICAAFETKEKKSFDNKWSVALGLAFIGLDDAPSSNYLKSEIAIKTKNLLNKWLRAFMP